MSSTNLLFHYSLTFRSSHYISSALDVTYLLVHLPSIEIKLSHFYLSPSPFIPPFPSLSLFSSDFSITFNSISNMHSVYLKHLLPQRFFLFLFCSSVIIGYAPIHDEVSTLLFQLFQTAKWRVH